MAIIRILYTGNGKNAGRSFSMTYMTGRIEYSSGLGMSWPASPASPQPSFYGQVSGRVSHPRPTQSCLVPRQKMLPVVCHGRPVQPPPPHSSVATSCITIKLGVLISPPSQAVSARVVVLVSGLRWPRSSKCWPRPSSWSEATLPALRPMLTNSPATFLALNRSQKPKQEKSPRSLAFSNRSLPRDILQVLLGPHTTSRLGGPTNEVCRASHLEPVSTP